MGHVVLISVPASNDSMPEVSIFREFKNESRLDIERTATLHANFIDDSGADPGFCVRVDEIRRGWWGS